MLISERTSIYFFFLMFLAFHVEAQITDTLPTQDTVPAIDTTVNIGSLDIEADTFRKSKNGYNPEVVAYRAQRSSMISGVIPGGGQWYNRDYWKLPILYAGAFAIGYSIYVNNLYYTYYRDALVAERNGMLDEYDRSVPDRVLFSATDATLLDEDQLRRTRESFRRDRDLSIILMSLFYAGTIVEATVAAHLKDFDVGEDLSVSFNPYISPLIPGQPRYFGLSASINWKE